MLDMNAIMVYLNNSISPKRYTHSVNVSTTAKKLAELYQCNVEKAEIAGLVHDCARDMDMTLQLDCINEEGIDLDDLAMGSRELIHGPAAVHICRKVIGIEDWEILNAVRYHTTGRENMTLLEKIIYLSDFIEPARCFPGVEELRRLAFKNLNQSLLLAFNSSIEYILSKNKLIHVDSIQARNFLLKELQGK